MLSKFLPSVIIVLFLASCATREKIKVAKKTIPNQISKLQNIAITPGEILLVRIPISQEIPSSYVPQSLQCRGSDISLITQPTEYWAFLGESYFSKLEPYECFLKYQVEDEVISTKIISVTVAKREFRKEKLKVDPRRVTLSPEDLKRVMLEQQELNRIYSASLEGPLFQKEFKQPMRSRITSSYGTQRLFNGTKQGQHLGIDFRAKIGTKVPAVNRGKVVLARELFYTGNTIIIDHGLKIFSVYGHLSKLNVNEGDIVDIGDIVGRVGNTGRTSGPHLHWGVKLNGDWLDGLSLIDASKAFGKVYATKVD